MLYKKVFKTKKFSREEEAKKFASKVNGWVEEEIKFCHDVYDIDKDYPSTRYRVYIVTYEDKPKKVRSVFINSTYLDYIYDSKKGMYREYNFEDDSWGDYLSDEEMLSIANSEGDGVYFINKNEDDEGNKQ